MVWSRWEFVEDAFGSFPLPLLANADGYFYLGLARDWLEGVYHSGAWGRVYPESPARPEPIPLLAWLAAAASARTHLPLELVASLLPALLGALVAIPVAVIANLMIGRWWAVFAALVAVLIPYFAFRSGLGWFDTDGIIMVLALAMAAISSGLLAKTPNPPRVVVACALFLMLAWLFYRAWDQAPAVVAALALYPLLIAIIFRWRDRWIRYTGLLLALGIVWLMPESPIQAIQSILGMGRYVASAETGLFSPTAIAIGEQQSLPFTLAAWETAGGVISLTLAVAGLVFLTLRWPILMLPLLPFLVISVMGFIFAERFLVFATPLIALGIAGFLYVLQQHTSFKGRRWLAGLLGVGLVLNLAYVQGADRRGPVVPLAVVEPMRALALELPENAVLWNLCDYGYALSYWTRRATVCDGSSHSGIRRTATAAPLYADSEIEAARFAHFFAAHGEAGLMQVMEMSAHRWPTAQAFLKTSFSRNRTALRDWIRQQNATMTDQEVEQFASFLMPSASRPVYLVLDRQTMRNTHWWFWFSSWNPDAGRGIHPTYIVFPELPEPPYGHVLEDDAGLFSIDLLRGVVRFHDQSRMLRGLNVLQNAKWSETRFASDEHWIMDLDLDQGYGVLHDPFTHGKLGHRLFMGHAVSRLFEPVYSVAPEFQVWRIHHPQTLAEAEGVGLTRR